MLVEESTLSTRAKNSLTRGGYLSMDDVILASVWDLRKCQEFGDKSLKEVEQWAKDNGAIAGNERQRMKQTLSAMEQRMAILERDIASIRCTLEKSV